MSAHIRGSVQTLLSRVVGLNKCHVPKLQLLVKLYFHANVLQGKQYLDLENIGNVYINKNILAFIGNINRRITNKIDSENFLDTCYLQN